MEAELKKILKAATLELRHLLEGRYDAGGHWKLGDLEQRLAAIGVRRDRDSVPVDELGHLTEEDRQARRVVDAYLKLREEAGDDRTEAVAEFVRETAYTWANRLLALRCMEARELIDAVILQQEAYGGRSLEHHRLAQRQPELCAGPDDGLFAVLDKVFREQAARLPMLFDPEAPGVTLRPSPAALKDCLGLLSLDVGTLDKYRIRLADDDAGADPASVFAAPDALGWAYQYWNTEEKDRVFERVRTVKGAKIAGADIIPATQLYTESYMVKFLVQNSLGATWLGMHPESRLAEGWEYYVKDADRAPVEKKPASEITFLDPACGSGHFLLEAFDLLYSMYEEEAAHGWSQFPTPNPQSLTPAQICDAILTKNLFGIDIDARAVQIAEVVLWMRAAERAFDYQGVPANLVAATGSHLKGEAWEEFLAGFEREPSVARVLRRFSVSMEHIDEIGSLARPAEDLQEIICEEHATWERQVREQREANFLFPEMRSEALSGQLPFHEISDDEFGHRLFNRARMALDGFTKMARERGEFDDQMLAGEARAGFRLMDLLSRRYDVVAANPPYMGSGNMGKAIKLHVERVLKPGKGDLYAAFILRNSQLAKSAGRVAMVTQQSWMFLKSFLSLRIVRAAECIGGILGETSIEAIAQLGRYAFTEIGNAAVSPVLFVLRSGPLPDGHRIWACRLTSPRPAPEQAKLLREACSGYGEDPTSNRNQFTPLQAAFCELPEGQLLYWLSDKCLALLKGRTLADVAQVAEPTTTGNSERFFRGWWECNIGERWRWASRGGGHRKWTGLKNWVIDWEFDGARIRSVSGSYLRNVELMFRTGLTYTEAAYGAFAVRELRKDECFAKSGPGIVPLNGNVSQIAAILNSRVSSYLLRASARSFLVSIGSVRGVPVPEIGDTVGHLAEPCIKFKKALLSSDLTERDFDPASYVDIESSLELSAILHSLEGENEQAVSRALGLESDELRAIYSEVGTPVAFLPIIVGRDELPSTDASDESLRIVRQHLNRCSRVTLPSNDLVDLKLNLKELFESDGIVGEMRYEENDEELGLEDNDSETGASFPIPAETLLEDLCNKVHFHPISVLHLVIEGISREGWHCLRAERRLWEGRVSVVILLLLGHRWPMQVEVGEPVSDWADPDGIIPITPLGQESTLFERVESRLTAEEIDASDFTQVMGKPLDAWLATEFFKHHSKQFKKRPIAWQLQSGKFTARKAPAFACLVYYHKLDADTLPKIRTQYVGPLRQRLETELRGIEAVAADARSDRQAKRRIELEEAIDELVKFDGKLEQVTREGFATPGLEKLLEGEPLDRWCSPDGKRPHPTTLADLVAQESAYAPDINDGVRVNIAPLQKAGLLAADVLAKKDIDKAIADRAAWRADERRWVREQKLPQPGWWPENKDEATKMKEPLSAETR